jgi:hypothetical protein
MRCCRYGVGGIAICGSEKTIVWRDEEDPPALTYPIGASGAIVSDQLDDDEGSEFLCCFLAKDKRMVCRVQTHIHESLSWGH